MSLPFTFVPINPDELDFETIPPNTTPFQTERVREGGETLAPSETINKNQFPSWAIALIIVAAIGIIIGVFYKFKQ